MEFQRREAKKEDRYRRVPAAKNRGGEESRFANQTHSIITCLRILQEAARGKEDIKN